MVNRTKICTNENFPLYGNIHDSLTKPMKMDLKTVEGIDREGVLMGKLMLCSSVKFILSHLILHFVVTIPDKLIMHLLLG